MAEVLNVKKRESFGKRRTRRMRTGGSIPAVLYGHGGETVSLAVPTEQLAAAIRHGSRLVELQGAVAEKALIRELQFDTFGVDVLHVDFARVSEDERIEVTVAIELRGEAPGLKDGGVVSHQLHEVEIECLAAAIPDKLYLSVNHLGLNQSLTIKDLSLPANVKVLAEDDTVVAECHEPKAVVESEAPAEGAEPELIGRKAEDEGEEGEE
ncbi:MAG: 50S ribosomal protein L25 [Pirellulales bacterium]|nr:50S ribosomal protein L25 [Pirellulales bacterium]